MQRTLEECIERYGKIVDNRWPQESEFCVLVLIPDKINMINSLTNKPAHHIYCNSDMAIPLENALENVVARGLAHELESFDGCLNIRVVRGTWDQPSTHSYALAIDLNAAKNKLGEMPTMSENLVKCFTDEGFAWGGNFARKDGMHFSYAWE